MAPLIAAVGLVVAMSLALLERKYAVFSGGFLQANPIQGIWAQARFVVIVLTMEACLAATVLCLALAATSRAAVTPSRMALAVAVIYLVVSATFQVVRYEVLAYFGDMVSFGVLRNLGGGSLGGAVLYAFDQYPAAFAGLLAGLVALAWTVRRLLRMPARPTSASAPPSRARTLTCLVGATGLLILLVAMAVIAREQRVERKHFSKINAYALVHSMLLWGTPTGGTSHLLGALRSSGEAMTTPPPLGARLPAQPMHLIVVVAESVRGDVLDAKVDGRFVAPTLRELADSGSRGRHFFSHSGFTTSSLKALFGADEGVRRHLDGSLFEVLQRSGYQVAVFSGQNEMFGEVEAAVHSRTPEGLFFDARDAASDRLFVSTAPGSMALSNDRVVDEFARRSAVLDWRRPVFGYLNLQAAHFPYGHAGMPLSVIKNPIDRRALHSGNPDLVRLAYLNAVAYTDASVARLVQHLKTRGQWDRTLLVVCGDHGEALFENGVLGHGVRADRLQHNALLVTNRRVPALDRVVGQRDLPPLLLQALGAQLSGPWEPEGERAFVYVGSLDSPDQLAFFHLDGSDEVLDLVNASYKSRRGTDATPIAALGTGSAEHRQMSELIDYWRHAFRRPPTEPATRTERRLPRP
jgi:glucan phosphoethanolaminetransferase (alkaline phosphatase superfamily)